MGKYPSQEDADKFNIDIKRIAWLPEGTSLPWFADYVQKDATAQQSSSPKAPSSPKASSSTEASSST